MFFNISKKRVDIHISREKIFQSAGLFEKTFTPHLRGVVECFFKVLTDCVDGEHNYKACILNSPSFVEYMHIHLLLDFFHYTNNNTTAVFQVVIFSQ